MIDKLQTLEEKYEALAQQMADPEIAGDPEKYTALAREYAELEELVKTFRQYKKVLSGLEEAQQVLKESDDPEMKELAREEMEALESEKESLEKRLQLLIVPPDPNDAKNAIVEIRAGTGGDEAAIFAGDLFKMYTHYCEDRGWKVEVLESNPSERGGFKEIIFSLEGTGAYGTLKYESGVHRVQRVPDTETQGRVHTSAVSVVVLPEAEEVDVQIDPNELRIDVYRSSGPGGQSVNTTDSAVRITHIPTGLVVSCQDEKSQLKNKNKALKVLRSRLLDQAMSEQHSAIAEQRKIMVGSGDRSAKIRTYNFPQGRVTDHRIGLTLYKLDRIMEGEIEELIEALQVEERAKRLEEMTNG